jgi:AcrR family transcriptional regulator
MVNEDYGDGRGTTVGEQTDLGAGRRRRPPLVTREQVVDVAYGLVVSDGPEGLSMRKLAGALHVSLPTVYTAIRSREFLVAQLQNRLFEDIAADLYADDTALAAGRGLEDRLETLTGAFLDWARANQQLADFLLSEQFSTEVAERFTHPDRAPSEAVSYLIGLFREMGRAGLLPAVEPVTGITFAVAQIRAVLSLMREPALSHVPAARWHALATATLLRGLQTLGG